MPKRLPIKRYFAMLLLAAVGSLIETVAVAQTTAFTYQGKLTDAGNPATGTYDMQFKLFDTPTVGTGTQQGSTITNPTVQVTNSNFTVTLDFGANVFDGTARYLEIGVRPAGDPNPHTILAPRQPITSSPYSIQTINTQQLGGLPASRYVASDVSGNVGLGTASPSARLDVVHPATQLRFGPTTADNGGYLVSTNPSQAILAGGARWNGSTWVARDTVASITAHTGGEIQFTTDSALSIGSAFTPTERMRIGVNGNVGIGTATPQSPLTVQTGILGYGLTHTNGTITVGTYVDATGGWLGTRSNHSLHFFTNDSLPKMTLDTLGNVGIGIATPLTPLHVRAFNPILLLQSTDNSVGPEVLFQTTFRVWRTGVYGPAQNTRAGSYYIYDELNGRERLRIDPDGNVGINTVGTIMRLLHVSGRARIGSIPAEPSVASVCFNADGDLLQCGASSLRLKANVKPFGMGLGVVRRLRPISFNWKENGGHDIGLGAEDVSKVAPSLTFMDSEGKVTGVKYERLNILLINAIKEQQQLIERQQRQIDALTRLACRSKARVDICKWKK